MSRNKAKEFYQMVRNMRHLQRQDERFRTLCTRADRLEAEKAVDEIIRRTEEALLQRQYKE